MQATPATASLAQTQPLWAGRHRVPEAAPLESNATADVCIVGAGIAGLSTGLLLAREGARVILLDSARPGSGESARTTAHLASAIDDRFRHIARWHGREGARFAAASHAAAIDRIETFVQELGLDCDFRRLDGYLFADPDDPSQTAAKLDLEYAAARAAGLTEIDFTPWPAPGAAGPRCLCFPRQAQLSPWPYLSGLASEFLRLGGRLYGDTRVTDFSEGPNPVVHTAAGPSVSATSLVFATNSPINDRFTIHTKQAPYRTYVLALLIPEHSLPPGLYWDDGDPYHYIRLAPSALPGHSMLIVGGEDHKTGQDADPAPRFDRLEAWTRRRFPVTEARPLARCSGQVMETVDGLAYLGRNPGAHDNTYIATGDSGMGLTHGTLAGMIINDLIHHRANPWSHLYNPGRVTLTAALTFAKENTNVALQLLDRGLHKSPADSHDLAPGQGCVVQRGRQRIALHRDADGELHARSAICTHLGCVVRWNPVESTWDCPCHGSRFSADGTVTNGPARENLAAIEDPDPQPAEASRASSAPDRA